MGKIEFQEDIIGNKYALGYQISNLLKSRTKFSVSFKPNFTILKIYKNANIKRKERTEKSVEEKDKNQRTSNSKA